MNSPSLFETFFGPVAATPGATPGATLGATLGEGTQRRLAALMALDVVNYSTLMARNEEDTHTRIGHVLEQAASYIRDSHGRVFSFSGDGVMAEFPSAVEAIKCALRIQADAAGRNANLAEDRRIEMRIGINSGDVVVERGRVGGDAVNIAARLEPLAEAGGIVISARVREDLAGNLAAAAEDMGEQVLKNIAAPIRAFRIRPAPAAGPALPNKPSIAVLAFTNMSGDADQEYFADGIAEDIITALSQIRWLFVIARNSSFTYKGRAVDLKQVGRELGVRYVLEGSVRRAGSRLRVTGQLVEAETGTHVWAERYDRTMEDMFDIQDELTRAVVTSIDSVLAETERERTGRLAPEHLGTWELYHRGLWHFFRLTRDDYCKAKEFLLQAERLDPRSAPVQTALAFCTLIGGWMHEPTKRPEFVPAGREFGRIATTLNARDATAHAFYAQGLSMEGEHEAAIRTSAIAVDLNPNNSWAQGMRGGVLALGGRPREALPHLEQALRLSPLDPLRWFWSHMGSIANFLSGDYEAALADGKDVIRAIPNAIFGYRHCLVALVGLGRIEEAKYYADIIHQRFAKEITYFITVRWGEYREVDHRLYVQTLAKGGLVLRDGVLTRVE